MDADGLKDDRDMQKLDGVSTDDTTRVNVKYRLKLWRKYGGQEGSQAAVFGVCAEGERLCNTLHLIYSKRSCKVLHSS